MAVLNYFPTTKLSVLFATVLKWMVQCVQSNINCYLYKIVFSETEKPFESKTIDNLAERHYRRKIIIILYYSCLADI